ncbi:TetR-like C-terminal domain-containing protein [Latilactobacillus curvatus]
MVNTILKEADLFCPNSVRINFTIYHIENNRHFCLNTFHSLNRYLLSRFLYRVAFNMVAGVVQDLKVDCPATFRDEIANFMVGHWRHRLRNGL